MTSPGIFTGPINARAEINTPGNELYPFEKPNGYLNAQAKVNPEAIIELSAHTDDIGDEKFNLELSEKRAASVVQYLAEKGIQDKNLKAKGYGEFVPLKANAKLARQYEFLKEGDVLNVTAIEKLGSDNLKELACGLNRRTEFRVINTGTAK